MFKWFQSKHEPRAIVALDIGTEIVKAILFTIEEKQNAAGEVTGRRAIIKGVGKIRHRSVDIQNGVVTDMHHIIENCKEAISQASAEAKLKPSELVMGIALGDEAKAYPVGLLSRREMVNDEIAGTPILVTW